MIDKILVAVDGSDPSINALDYAASLADIRDSELIILNVAPELTYISPASFSRREDLHSLQSDVEKDRKKMLQEHVDRLQTLYPTLKAKPIVKTGSARKNIIDVSHEENVDLIVVGNRGKSGVATWMLGSVSRDIVESCTVPVLVVKDRKYCEI
jgi:nucleotide-binding universal stress UspA family protein